LELLTNTRNTSSPPSAILYAVDGLLQSRGLPLKSKSLEMGKFLFELPCDLARTEKLNVDAAFLKCYPPSPPLTIKTLKDCRMLGVRSHNSDKFSIRPIEIPEFRMIWKFLEIICVAGFLDDGDLRTALGIRMICQHPLEEGIPGPRLTGLVEFTAIFPDHEPRVVED
jgi:hypothetical protein